MAALDAARRRSTSCSRATRRSPTRPRSARRTGSRPEDSANTILVIGKSDPPRYAACVVLAPNRLDVNRAVRDRLGTRKASFAPAESTREITGMEIGGVTVFGLPAGLPIWVDARVMDRERIVLGGGSRSWKVLAAPAILLARCRGSRSSTAWRPIRARLDDPAGLTRRPSRIVPAVRRPPTVDPNADPTPPRPPRPTGPVQYKGEDLEPQRGPGLGCFRFQLVVLVVLIVLTPLSVVWDWPDWRERAAAVRRDRAAAPDRPDDHLPAPARRRRPARPAPPAGQCHEDGRGARRSKAGTAIAAPGATTPGAVDRDAVAARRR